MKRIFISAPCVPNCFYHNKDPNAEDVRQLLVRGKEGSVLWYESRMRRSKHCMVKHAQRRIDHVFHFKKERVRVHGPRNRGVWEEPNKLIYSHYDVTKENECGAWYDV